MKNSSLITVLTVSYPHELLIIQGKLESEGIRCFVTNNITIGADPLLSNAVGGVKLQVKEEDYLQAAAILSEGGYAEIASTPPKFYTALLKATSGIPGINRLPVELRLMILIGMIALAVIGVLFLLNR